MPAFVDITRGKTPAEANDIQQVIEALSARRNIPLANFIADALAYNLTLKNTDPSGRGLIVYAPDGVTALLQVDASGVKVSPDGTAAVTPVTHLGPAAGSAAEGNHQHGAGGYTGVGTTTLEALFGGSWTVQNANYAVAAGILFVFCTLGITVTLPDATTTNRFVVVTAVTGSTTVASAGGGVIGGSLNTGTGVVMDGVVSQGDSIMYKSDGTNWRAVG